MSGTNLLHGVRFSTFLRKLVGRGKAVSMLTLASNFAKVHKLKSKSKLRRAANAERMLRRYIDQKLRPGPFVAWDIGEALRLSGITWCNGLVALYAAGHFSDAVGVLWRRTLKSRIQGDALESLAGAAPIVVGLVNASTLKDLFATMAEEQSNFPESYSWKFTRTAPPEATAEERDAFGIKCRTNCEIPIFIIDELNSVWPKWKSMRSAVKANPALNALDHSFPDKAYAIATDRRRSSQQRALGIFASMIDRRWL